MDETSTTTTARHLDAVLIELADLMSGVSADRAHARTPCHEYDVAALRGHVLGWLTAFTDGFTDPEGRCSDPEQVAVDGDGARQVRDLAARLRGVLPGAAASPLVIGEAGMPGEMALSMILWEYQVHGWDLAAATGATWDPDEDGVTASLLFAPAMLTPDYQGEGKPFAPRVPVPEEAPALDRLVGLSGRDPGWSPDRTLTPPRSATAGSGGAR